VTPQFSTDGRKNMRYLHLLFVPSEAHDLVERFITKYNTMHPQVILRHAAGHVEYGATYVIYATEDITEVLREEGMPPKTIPITEEMRYMFPE
jgi:hypothetical protein